MNNLVPEKRMDKNGKLVTKHVRTEAPQRSQKARIPSPQLGAAAAKNAPQKPFKPRPAQLEQEYRSFTASNYALDFRLSPAPSYNSYYAFTASETEIYEVLAATDCGGNALTMLQAGVRDAEGVKRYLKEHKAMDLFLDRDFAQEALQKNVSSYDFIAKDEDFPSSYRESPHYVDVVRFASSSLYVSMRQPELEDIAKGDISYDDIKAIGITLLKPHDRLSSLGKTLQRMNKGEGDFTVEKVKTLIKRSQDEKLERMDFNYLCRTMDEVGIDAVLECKSLERVSREFHAYKLSPGSSRYDDSNDAIDRALYSAKLKGELSGLMSLYFADPFYDAGIPVEVAIEVASQGGGVLEAKAIHEEGISASVAGGWL